MAHVPCPGDNSTGARRRDWGGKAAAGVWGPPNVPFIAGTSFVLDQCGQVYEAVGTAIEKLGTRVAHAKKP
jgi:hypothetical protein